MQPTIDPVLEFYRKQALVVNDSCNPMVHGAAFSLETVTFLKHLNREGVVVRVDTARGRYFFSNGGLDSQIVSGTENSRIRDLDFGYPNVFGQESRFNLFPNDTGGALLAIGFDNDTSVAQTPVGLALINRDRYHLCWLYLYYPNRSGFTRFSRSFRLTWQDGFVFPDSIWEVGARPGIFSPEYYRLETSISNIAVRR